MRSTRCAPPGASACSSPSAAAPSATTTWSSTSARSRSCAGSRPWSSTPRTASSRPAARAARPAASRLLEDAVEVHAVISPAYGAWRDHPLRYLARYPTLHVREIAPPARRGPRLGRLAAHLRGTVPYAVWFLLRKRVQVVAVEW